MASPSAAGASAADGVAAAAVPSVGTGANVSVESELRETISKYKRVTARLKEVLQQTKQSATDAGARVKALEAELAAVRAGGGGDGDSDGDGAAATTKLPSGPPAPSTQALWECLQRIEASGVAASRACAVQARIAAPDGGGVWCLVRATEAGRAVWTGWVQEVPLVDHVPDVTLPSLMPSLEELSEQRLALQAAEAAKKVAQDEYRRFRIRSETIVRQKDDEIDRLSKLLARRDGDLYSGVGGDAAGVSDSGSGGGGGGGGDPDRLSPAAADGNRVEELTAKLAATQRRLEGLLQAKADWAEKESDMLDDIAALKLQVQRAAEPVAGSGAATPPNLPPQARPSSPASVRSPEASELHRVMTEYSEYRRRAMDLIKEKEEAMNKLSAQLRAARVAAAAAPILDGGGGGGGGVAAHPPHGRKPSSSAVSVSASEFGDSASARADMFASEATKEYLKNTLLKYMTTSDVVVRQQLEACIAAVVEFTPSEIQRVKASRAANKPSGLWSLLGK